MKTRYNERSKKRRVRRHTGIALSLVVSLESTRSPNQEGTEDPLYVTEANRENFIRSKLEKILYGREAERGAFCVERALLPFRLPIYLQIFSFDPKN